MGALTECLALELAPAIRVNAVAPGSVLPPDGTNAGDLEQLRQRIPAGRFGAPADVCEAALFLLTGPRFITGQLLAVDGGRSLA
jgi:NAD(P)-dependent dehydrogenase (short-subunit alcohol dehydrogenase family)